MHARWQGYGYAHPERISFFHLIFDNRKLKILSFHHTPKWSVQIVGMNFRTQSGTAPALI
ncbi:DUF6783 domain-containing protein [Blautia producta]|uniref:DUF6783 domain-containing protein n=1 Tax=Blautia producta TaxID=33035 RepID=UPI0036F2C661